MKKPEIVEIGVKPGEKLYEELMSDEEMHRSVETSKYFIVLPAFRDMYSFEYNYDDVVSEDVTNPYISSEEPAMSVEELTDYLVTNKII